MPIRFRGTLRFSQPYPVSTPDGREPVDGVAVGGHSVSESSYLEMTAEVAVAFTGFISIFLVLATREGRFRAVEAWGIRLIVGCSVASAFLSALPLVLHALGLSGPTLWRVSSGAILLFAAASGPYMVRRFRELPPGEGRSLNLMFWLAVLALLSAFGNTLGWPWTPSGGPHLVAIWSIIGVAAGNFVGLVFSRVL